MATKKKAARKPRTARSPRAKASNILVEVATKGATAEEVYETVAIALDELSVADRVKVIGSYLTNLRTSAAAAVETAQKNHQDIETLLSTIGSTDVLPDAALTLEEIAESKVEVVNAVVAGEETKYE